MKDGGNWKTACCKKHDLMYVGYTGKSLANPFGKHWSDVKNRPDNCELGKHFNRGHDKEDLEVCILQSGSNL